MTGWLFSALVLIGSLVGLTGLRQFFIDPMPAAGVNAIWFVAQLLPLLLPLPGLLRQKLLSTFFLCMASNLYFIHGVLLAFDSSMRLLGIVEIVCALGLTAVSAWIVRRLREEAASPDR